MELSFGAAFLSPGEGGGAMDARGIAASWARPYTSVQRAWVDALGVPPAPWSGRGRGTPRPGRYRGAARLIRQRHGVRGL